jgi:hypothetical protein
MSYLSVGSAAQGVQLKVQELILKLSDSQVITKTGTSSVVTIDCGQDVESVVQALFIDDSAGTIAPVAVANRSVSGQNVTLTLSAEMLANDSVRLCFIVA